MMLWVFSAALFLSASLMFALQPMAGKMLLPIVGGAPAGWITAMAFFQTALLAGYYLAHLLSRWNPRVQTVVYLAGMAGASYFLPMALPADAQASNAADVFLLLAKTAGLPFVFLAATSSTLQRLFSATDHPSAKDPYFLYAASNLGSLAGLFCYPFFLEPLMGLGAQAGAFFYTHIVIALLAVACLLLSGNTKEQPCEKSMAASSCGERMRWILLSFIPSSLLLGVTTHITTDIFSAPLLWVLPLAIYIGTFIAAFAQRQFFALSGIQRLHLPAVALSIAVVLLFNASIRVSFNAVLLHLAAFGITALLCHKLLAAARPDKSRLTEFYLMIALGGALGGLLNAFVIPVVLDRLIEYPLLLSLSILINPAFREKISYKTAVLAGAGGVSLIFLISLVRAEADALTGTLAGLMNGSILAADMCLLTALILPSMHPKTALAGTLSVLLAMEFIAPKNILLAERNFFGVVKVFEMPQKINNKDYIAKYMYHGTTTHGFQIQSAEFEKTPTAYFTRTGPVGQVFEALAPKKILVTGLGAGTINCYKTPENEITFIEIDPAVIKIAQKQFTYLSTCGMPRIITGDGRLALAKLEEKFDLIIIDAFSSDTIPTHLITTEALKIYADHLTLNGVMIFNLSNRYINLWYSLITTAANAGLDSRFILDIELDEPYAAYSQWLAVAPDNNRLKPLEKLGWIAIPPSKDLRPWTDDYTNLLSTLEF